MAAHPQAAQSLPPGAQILNLATGYWLARAVYIAAQLGIADLVKSEPKSVEHLAAATETDPDALYRILRALASEGVFTESGRRRFGHTELSQTLRSNTPDSMRAMVLFLGDHVHWSVYSEMLHSVQTGQPAFDKVFGMKPFEYLIEHPEDARVFDEAMIAHSALANEAIADAYDFSAFGTVMDIGGGNGGLLATILKKHTQPRGILFDLPHVIERARKKAILNGNRSEMLAGSFFVNVPGRADGYLMKHVIHDWDDESALAIFRNCRRVMAGSNKLLVAEILIKPGNEPSFAKLLDLEMLVLPGGRERTAEEYRDLFTAAELRLTRIIPTRSPVSLIEAAPV